MNSKKAKALRKAAKIYSQKQEMNESCEEKFKQECYKMLKRKNKEVKNEWVSKKNN